MCINTRYRNSKRIFKNNIKECNIQIIKGADHSFTDKYEELGEVINNNI